MQDSNETLKTIEGESLALVALILSYSPESAFANQSPTMYGMLFCGAKRVLEACGIVPDENIRCWFWQLDAFRNGQKVTYPKSMKGLYDTPWLNTEMQHWETPDGRRISDSEFRMRWRN